jgi:CRP-like cAMP-binding protein
VADFSIRASGPFSEIVPARMIAPLIHKLDSLELLSDQAKVRLAGLISRMSSHAPREDIVREAEARGDLRVLVDGVACRYKVFNGGRQAILGFLLPGDVDEVDGALERFDHHISTVTPVRMVHVARPVLEQAIQDHPEIGRALRRMAAVEHATLRIWLANMGQRAADKQAAHLFCELRMRMAAVGLGGADWFNNPFTQEQFANVLGISAVHMNRVMQHLREMKLMRIDGRIIRFPDVSRIENFADFQAGYLLGFNSTSRKE